LLSTNNKQNKIIEILKNLEFADQQKNSGEPTNSTSPSEGTASAIKSVIRQQQQLQQPGSVFGNEKKDQDYGGLPQESNVVETGMKYVIYLFIFLFCFVHLFFFILCLTCFILFYFEIQHLDCLLQLQPFKPQENYIMRKMNGGN